MPMLLPLSLALVFASATTAVAPAPLVPFDVKSDDDAARALREHYTKREVMIPMRDGVKLYTHIWTPKPSTQTAPGTTTTWPFLIVRTPYGVSPYGIENQPDPKNPRVLGRLVPVKELLRLGYIFVQQDVRGRMMSEGTFVDVRPMLAKGARGIDESTDAWDTIDWLMKNVKPNNGRAGLWGISYPGFYAAQGAVDAHPALKAVSPQAPVTEWFIGDDFHHNGALCLADAFGFYAGFGKARKKPTKTWNWDPEVPIDVGDVYDFHLRAGTLKQLTAKYMETRIAFWDELMAHPNRDAWWTARDPRPFYANIKPATLVVGGLFDAEDLWGSVATYQSMEKQTPKGAGNRISLVLGPWKHGGWHRTDGDALGDITFAMKTSVSFRENIEVPFWESHLKGDGAAKIAEANVFFTGRNEWRALDAWPPRSTPVAMHFGARGALSTTKPSAGSADSFVSDPMRPVPYMGRASEEIDHDYMTADQRFAHRRPDVLTYETAPLVDDVTIAGPVTADVYFATTSTDADVIVKLIDVWPEDTLDPDPNPKGIRMAGYQQLVRGEIMRGRFRNSFASPQAFKPNEPALVKVELPDVAHTFRTGHRIMVQVQSSWFPLMDRNPQTFVENIANADEKDFVKATHTVHRSQTMASGVTFRVVEGKLPP